MNFYNNGSLEVMWSHNQGSAGDALWPYTLYKYNKESDSYDVIAQVDAWDKSFYEKCYIAEIFPIEVVLPAPLTPTTNITAGFVFNFNDASLEFKISEIISHKAFFTSSESSILFNLILSLNSLIILV